MQQESKIRTAHVGIVGAGPVGSLLSLYLAKRGFQCDLYERRADLREGGVSGGRSINLAVSTRGLYALRQVGLEDEILRQAIPMRGRMIHSLTGQLTFQPYGIDDTQCIHSISRAGLNGALMSFAEKTGRVQIHFQHKVTGLCLETGELEIENELGQHQILTQHQTLIGTDGSASVLRREMLRKQGHRCTESYVEYGYKELTIPADALGGFRLEKNALHIWPRGTFMLIALPNFDGSFTCTLFLPHQGSLSFESLDSRGAVVGFFNQHFPDAAPLLEDLEDVFFSHPTGSMVTVNCFPWHFLDKTLLLGDAAHAIVPFFGQGMNCGFEDCTVLDELISKHIRGAAEPSLEKADSVSLARSYLVSSDAGSNVALGSAPQVRWGEVFSEFTTMRKPHADSIAEMALENFVEMRDKVGNAKFLLEKEIEKVLQEKFPGEYISRYSLVTFSRIPYQLAYRAGLIQNEILAELCRDVGEAQEVDLEKAAHLIRTKLRPVLNDVV